MDSIEMKIAKTAASNWGQPEPQNLEEAKGITWGSEVSSIQGIISVLGLNPEVEKRMIDDIYTKDTISEDISKEIQSKISDKGTNTSIIKMLSVVHDEWVKNNSNNFLRVNDGKPRNKEYQFVPLEMLSWKEAKSDLLFLKPILEAAGVKVDEKQIEEQFEITQKDFIIEKGITSPESLKLKVGQGASFYPALKGLETKNGGNIEELLKQDEIVERMATQIQGQVPIKSREELAMDIIKGENPAYNEIFHLKTTSYEGNFNEEKCPHIDQYVSQKEIMLSKLIGKPYPTYVLSGIMNDNHDVYQNSLQEVGRDYGADAKAANITSMGIKASQIGEEKKGRIDFGYTTTGEKLQGSIEVTDKDLLAGGINPEHVGWEEITRKKGLLSKKGISEAAISCKISKSDNHESKNIFSKILDKLKGVEGRE